MNALLGMHGEMARFQAILRADTYSVNASRDKLGWTGGNNILAEADGVWKHRKKAIACSLLSQLDILQLSLKQLVDDDASC
ncbi:MAG: hypothetical protein ABEI52_05540 [Halobacteriaceae archaeon]